LVYWPTDTKGGLPVYVFFHAGGYILGSPELLEGQCRNIVNEHHVVVIAPSYRIAPEDPFPASVDDVWDWVLWIAHHSKTELDVGADPMKGYIIAGESVGGNMALVAALRARENPEELQRVSITGIHIMCAQLCSAEGTPEQYKKWYTSYDQCRDAPVFNRKVQDAITGTFLSLSICLPWTMTRPSLSLTSRILTRHHAHRSSQTRRKVLQMEPNHPLPGSRQPPTRLHYDIWFRPIS
jgi:hypothetical protein